VGVVTEQPSQRPASAPGPIPPPHNPLHAPNPYRDVFADLTEKVMARLDLARAADSQARADTARPGATGESLDGGVEVDVDGKGLIAAVRYTGIVSGMTPDQLRDHTLAALRSAQDSLPGRRVADGALAQLHDRSVAMTILDIARREKRA
jgi:hypothetical protein